TIDGWTASHRLSAAQQAALTRLRDRDACTPTPGQPACRPLSRDDRKRMDQLSARQQQVDVVTQFLPKLHDLYRVTLIDPDTMEHEEIIRGTTTSDALYVKGEGTLEKGLESLP